MDHPAAIIVPSDDRDKLVKFWIFGEKEVGTSALVQKFVVSHHGMYSVIITIYTVTVTIIIMMRLDGPAPI